MSRCPNDLTRIGQCHTLGSMRSASVRTASGTLELDRTHDLTPQGIAALCLGLRRRPRLGDRAPAHPPRVMRGAQLVPPPKARETRARLSPAAATSACACATAWRPCRSATSARASATTGPRGRTRMRQVTPRLDRREPRGLEQFVECRENESLELRRPAVASDQVERGIPVARSAIVVEARREHRPSAGTRPFCAALAPRGTTRASGCSSSVLPRSTRIPTSSAAGRSPRQPRLQE